MADYNTGETLDDYADTPAVSRPDSSDDTAKESDDSGISIVWYIVGASILVVLIVVLIWYMGYMPFLDPYLGGIAGMIGMSGGASSAASNSSSSGTTTTDPTMIYKNDDFMVLIKEKSTWGPNAEGNLINMVSKANAPTISGWQNVGLAGSFDECLAKVNNTQTVAMNSAVFFPGSGKCLGRSI